MRFRLQCPGYSGLVMCIKSLARLPSSQYSHLLPVQLAKVGNIAVSGCILPAQPCSSLLLQDRRYLPLWSAKTQYVVVPPRPKSPLVFPPVSLLKSPPVSHQRCLPASQLALLPAFLLNLPPEALRRPQSSSHLQARS
jgi:hypothetical protein